MVLILAETGPEKGPGNGFSFYEKLLDKLPINKIKTQHVIWFLGYAMLGFFILLYKFFTGEPPAPYMKDVYFGWVMITVTFSALRIEFRKKT